MDIVILVSVGMLLVAAGITMIRLVGPGALENRAVALDVLTSIIVCGVFAWAASDGSGEFLDIALVLTVVGFLSAVTIARFIERGSE